MYPESTVCPRGAGTFDNRIMRRRTFLLGAIGAGCLAGQSGGRTRETLAYLTDDGLWIRDLPDGAPERLAAAGSRMASPRISASGEWIAFQEDRRTRVVSRAVARQSPIVLGESSSAQWRPSRDELLLAQPHGISVYSASNRWASPVRFFPDATLPAVFSPDGRELLYSATIESGTAPGSGATGLLCRVDANASLPPKTIRSRWSEGPIPYAWVEGAVWYWVDPDFSGSFQADGLELFRLPAAGGEPHSMGVKTLVHDDFLALSPTGDRVAVTDGAGRESWNNKRIALIDLASAVSRYRTAENLAAICPSWSPDGKRLAFTALPEGLERTDRSGPERLFLGKRRIWIADAAGNAPPIPLANDDRYRDEHPIWLADGRRILFTRIERSAGRAVKSFWMMDEHGASPTQVAGPLLDNDTFEGESWFGYYGTIDWRAVMDYQRM